MIRVLLGLALLGSAATAAAAQERHPKNDYPTAARADYVIGCLAGSGFKRELLERCSCAIDTIANTMSFEDYDQASTVLSMQQGGLGERGAMFRETPIAKQRMEELRRAQADATLNCH